MARIRTIKPELPQSETLGRVSREARLCFILLWTQADDAGRLRGNSRMLASLLFPYDDDARDLIEGWLDELEDAGCIRRYIADGCNFIDIPKWLEHQKIDKPSLSKIPEFVEGSRAFAKPRESSAADQGRDQGREGKEPSLRSGSSPALFEAAPDVPDPVTEAVEAWNLLAHDIGLPKVQKLTDARRTKLRARLKDCGGIEGWHVALGKVRGSPFLRGDNGRWAADFDFLLQDKSFTKLMEGAYDDRRQPAHDTDQRRRDLLNDVLDVVGEAYGGIEGPGDLAAA